MFSSPPFHPQSVFGKQLMGSSASKNPPPVANQEYRSTLSIRSRSKSPCNTGPKPLPISFLDLPGEIRNRIWHCCGYMNVDYIPITSRLQRIAQACPEVRTEVKSLFCENHIFMFHLRNLDLGHRVAVWRTWLSGISNEEASRLQCLIFYFPNFTFMASISPASPTGPTKPSIKLDYRPNKADAAGRPYPTWLKHAAESRLDALSDRICKFGNIGGRLGRWGIDSIAKLAFGMVPYMHFHHTRLDSPALRGEADDDDLSFEQKVLRHAWMCPECEWACEMTGIMGTL